MVFEIGRICVKLAGRDSNKKCVIVEKVADNFVIVDGSTRRRNCNVKHLMPLEQTVDIKDKASHEEVAAAFKEAGFEVWNKKSKPKTERPKKIRTAKAKPVKKKVEKTVADVKAEMAKAQKEAPKAEKAPVEKTEVKEEKIE